MPATLRVCVALLLGLALQHAQAQKPEYPAASNTPLSTQPSPEAKTTALTWQYAGKTDFEHRLPGYGISYRFINDADVKADIYLYDLGKKNWKDGISDPDLLKVLDMARNEIHQVQKEGRYKQADFSHTLKTSIDGHDFYVQPVQLKTEYDQISSFIYLGSLNHQLLKFRISFINPPAFFDIEQISQDFIKNMLNNLQHLEKTADAKEPGQVL